jgi:hypothetical protein
MPSPKAPKGRANQSAVDDIHGFLARAILDIFKNHRKSKTLPAPNFLAQAIKFLERTGTTDPTRNTKGPDRLAGMLERYMADEGAAATNPTTDPIVDFSTTLPERDNAAPIPRHPGRAFDDDFPS